MSPLTVISSIAALLAICHAVPTADYEVLSNPVLVTFTEAIEQAVDTTQVPTYDHLADGFRNIRVKSEYIDCAHRYKGAHNLYERALNLQHLIKLKTMIVKDILTNSREKLNATSNKEAKQIFLEACRSLKGLVKLILDEEPVNWDNTEDYMKGDKQKLNVIGLNMFCKFLS